MTNYYPDYDSTITALENEFGSSQADILPAWIFCPGCTRSPTGPIDFTNCAGESDLPSRFLLGQLVPGSFKRLPTEFSVRYASPYIDTLLINDGDKLQCDVKIERSDPYFHVVHYSPINWNPALIHQVTPTKPELDQGLKSVLELDFNVRYKCGALREALGDVCYVPDGYALPS
jgi:hypothetical protein